MNMTLPIPGRFRTLSLLALTPLLLAACGSSNPSSPNTTTTQSSTSSTGSTGSIPTASLTISPQNPTVAPGGTVTFSTTGGVAPYYYYVTSGTGTINGATFTAPSSPEVDQIAVADSSGLATMTSVTVSTSASTSTTGTSNTGGSGLQISPVNPTIAVGSSISFTVSGGVAPYFYFITSGSGTFNGNTYTAPGSPETDQVEITDSSGLSATTTVTVTSSGSSSSSSSSSTSSSSGSPSGGSEVPVYRFYKASTGEHFFSLSPTEGTSAGFVSEGTGFNVYSTAWTTGMIPLYRCYVLNFMHFISDEANCEGAAGAVLEGSYGYVFPTQASGTTPLYRFFNPATGDHLETTDYSEGSNAGYKFEFILGYVPTS